MTVRLGVIGLGNIARQHIQNVESGAVSDCQITALCSRNRPDDLPEGSVHFTDYQTLIHSGVCDAVLIASPTMMHRDMGLCALNAGLHVMMEKPIALSIAEAQQLIDAKTGNQVFALMLNQRCAPVFQTMKQLIDEGALGAIQRSHWTMTNWFRPDVYFNVSDWRATWKGEGGGLLVNQCIHNLDIYQWLCGLPVQVTAHCSMGKYHPIEVEDEVTAMFRYESGASGSFVGSTGEAPGFNRFEIVGDLASLSFDGDRLMLHSNKQSSAEFCRSTVDMFGMPDCKVQDITPDESGTNQHALIMSNFVRALEQGEPLIAPAEESIRSLGLANAILMSHWQAQSVHCPPSATDFQSLLDQRIAQSGLREKQNIDVNIDMSKSYR